MSFESVAFGFPLTWTVGPMPFLVIGSSQERHVHLKDACFWSFGNRATRIYSCDGCCTSQRDLLRPLQHHKGCTLAKRIQDVIALLMRGA
jgi:hypothetical protein